MSALAHMTNVQEFEKSRNVRDAKALHPSQVRSIMVGSFLDISFFFWIGFD